MQAIFARITKVDEVTRTVTGRAAQEVIDRDNEVFDYKTSKPNFQSWSADVYKDTNGASLGNVRAMHGNTCAGKLTDIQFDDVEKAIDVSAKIVDDNEWKKVTEGCYSGFSIGGRYARKWAAPLNGKMVSYYTAMPSEISIVDRPCVPTAKFFSVHKRDGSVEERPFKIDLSKYNEDQPRDDHGRFGSGGSKSEAERHSDMAELHDKMAEQSKGKTKEAHHQASKAHSSAALAHRDTSGKDGRAKADRQSARAYAMSNNLGITASDVGKFVIDVDQLSKYSEDQPRDDHGRFGSGGKGGRDAHTRNAIIRAQRASHAAHDPEKSSSRGKSLSSEAEKATYEANFQSSWEKSDSDDRDKPSKATIVSTQKDAADSHKAAAAYHSAHGNDAAARQHNSAAASHTALARHYSRNW